MSQSSGFCDTSVPTPAPSREQLCSPQEFSLPQGFGQHLPSLCLSPGLKQAGKASLKFAASCVFFGLEIPSELYRRKVVGTSLLSQSHRWALNTCGSPAHGLCFESCLERLAPGCPKAAFPNFRRVTTALEDGLASWEFSSISQIIFFYFSNSQSTSPLMYSLPHAAKQAPGLELAKSHDSGSFGPDSKCSLCCSHLSPPPSPALTEHQNFTCS